MGTRYDVVLCLAVACVLRTAVDEYSRVRAEGNGPLRKKRKRLPTRDLYFAAEAI